MNRIGEKSSHFEAKEDLFLLVVARLRYLGERCVCRKTNFPENANLLAV